MVLYGVIIAGYVVRRNADLGQNAAMAAVLDCQRFLLDLVEIPVAFTYKGTPLVEILPVACKLDSTPPCVMYGTLLVGRYVQHATGRNLTSGVRPTRHW